MKKTFAVLIASSIAVEAVAEGENVNINPPAEGSVSREEGLDAWSRIYEVTSHPRCSNCRCRQYSYVVGAKVR